MDDGFVPNDTVPLLPQFGVNVTAADIWLVMLGFPTACRNNL